ncbi:DUF4232 domain-containing protein [Saccharomonospora piscinae]|uniref:DUF4232 domain-containing protein n=1 Tax=Saccharomonospora piscinae TaxID=687388 RepID=UPI001106AAB2|nr:DUF4232 domain-containing protein [Saccharomonospora piscinae]TLW93710.1 DUF4232 domain-containing protein [Saccharomonospora piscinae]
MTRDTRVRRLLVAVGTALALTACGSGTEASDTGAAEGTGATSEAPVAEPVSESPSELRAQVGSTPDTAPPGTPAAEPESAEPERTQAPPRPPQDPDYCASGNLSLTLGEGGGAAGTVYRPLRFTNVGDVPCVLHGFPGVSYVAGDDGHQVGEAAMHTGGKGAALTLRPGEVAHADVGFTQVRNYDESTCHPTDVRGLRIYPPQETASLFVESPGTGCASGAVRDQLSVSTIEAGAGGR